MFGALGRGYKWVGDNVGGVATAFGGLFALFWGAATNFYVETAEEVTNSGTLTAFWRVLGMDPKTGNIDLIEGAKGIVKGWGHSLTAGFNIAAPYVLDPGTAWVGKKLTDTFGITASSPADEFNFGVPAPMSLTNAFGLESLSTKVSEYSGAIMQALNLGDDNAPEYAMAA
ncbi:MAG: hypothetical protein DHS20C02_02170 [Micavibrio sp.]|nr:MAG: hypothetical protein DHS20C02_02170 [Micavibrio sp.]